jgi:hypothetical protein
LKFLGVDKLIQRVGKAILRPFGKIFGRLKARFEAWMKRRRERRGAARGRRGDRRGDRRGRRDDRRDRRDGRHDDDQRRRREERERQNRERLERAASELPPRINSLLANGVSRIRLWAQLAYWRLRYRIRKLAAEARGSGRYSIVAANSPEREIATAATPQEAALLRVVREEAEAYFRRRGRAGLVGAGTERNPRRSTASGSAIPGLMHHHSTQPQGLFSQQVLSAGDSRHGPLIFNRQQGFGQERGGIIRAIPGPGEILRLGTMGEIANALSSEVGSGSRAAGAVLEVVQGGRLETRMPRRASRVVAATAGLVAEENVRSSASRLVLPVRLQAAAAGDIDLHTALDRAPSAPRKAAAVERGVRAEIGMQQLPTLAENPPGPGGTRATRAEQVGAEMESLRLDSTIRSIVLRLGAEGVFLTDASQLEPLRKRIRDMLRGIYGSR